MNSAQMYGARTIEYAGFWLRVVAWFIDTIVLSIGLFVVQLPFGVALGMIMAANKTKTDDPANLGLVIGYYCIALVIGNIATLGYFAGFECTKQATPGKMALGLRVTDVNGNKISFLHAIGRNAGKYVSGLILEIGYIMCAFTERKQCLHDMMAGTLVVKKQQ